MHFRRTQVVPVLAIASAFVVALAHRPGLWAAGMRVEAQVQSIARAEGPFSVALEPGEIRDVVIKVAANFAWRLSIDSSNPAISTVPVERSGPAGGFSTRGNTIIVQFQCDPDASGTQSGGIGYSITRR